MSPIRKLTRIKQPQAKRGLGLRILLASLTAGAVGIAPLLLYILLGPADGNPIGLGLLAVLASAIGIIGGLIGAVTICIGYLQRTRS